MLADTFETRFEPFTRDKPRVRYFNREPLQDCNLISEIPTVPLAAREYASDRIHT